MLLEIPYFVVRATLKLVFRLNFGELFLHKVKRIILREVRFHPHKVRLNIEKLVKLKKTGILSF